MHEGVGCVIFCYMLQSMLSSARASMHADAARAWGDIQLTRARTNLMHAGKYQKMMQTIHKTQRRRYAVHAGRARHLPTDL